MNSIRNASDRVIAEDSSVEINLISNPVTSELYYVCECGATVSLCLRDGRTALGE